MFNVSKNSFLFPQSILDFFFHRYTYIQLKEKIYQLRLQLILNYFHIISSSGYLKVKIHSSKTLERKKGKKRVGGEEGRKRKRMKGKRICIVSHPPCLMK